MRIPIRRRTKRNTLQNSIIPIGDKGHIEIRPLTTDELPPETLEAFLAVGFTNHYEILAQKKDVEQRLFYIVNCATGFWNEGLDYELTKDLHLISQFHNLFQHTLFAITDFIYVRIFKTEINIEIIK